MTKKISISEEQLEDELHEAANVASKRLKEAMADYSAAEAEADGSDAAWERVETAKRLLERRQVEFKTAESKWQTARTTLDAKTRQANLKKLGDLVARADVAATRAEIDRVAHRAANLAVSLQRLRNRVREIAQKQTAMVGAARQLGEELGELVLVSRVEQLEADIVFSQRLAHWALADHRLALEPLRVTAPQVLDRPPRTNEEMVPMHRDIVSAERIATNLWRDLVDAFASSKPVASPPTNEDGVLDGNTENEIKQQEETAQ